MNYDFINNPDPKIIAFQKALGQKESNNTPVPLDTKITMTEGSVGRFQYLPETFNRYAKKYFGGVNPTTGKPLDVRNDTDQKFVNYAYIQDKMKQKNPETGEYYSPYDIAASWNAGEGRINDWQNMKGKNKYGNSYDVPAYADEVVHMYRENMKTLNDNTYQPRQFDPRRDTTEAKFADDNAEQYLKEQELTREQKLQAYKDGPNILPDFLDPLTDGMGDFSEGVNKFSQNMVGEAATTLNDVFQFSDNPLLIRGSKANEQYVNKATEADNATQTAGKLSAEAIKFGAEMYAGGKLAKTAFGALAGGAGGKTLQKAILTKGIGGTASRLGLDVAANELPFLVDQMLTNPESFGLNSDTLLPAAFAIGVGALTGVGKTARYGRIFDRIADLKKAGKFEEAEKLIASNEYTKELIKNGIRSEKDFAEKAAKEIPVVRESLNEILPTTSSLKISKMSDDSIIQAVSNFSKKLDSNGNFTTVDDVNNLRKAGSELMEDADSLSKNISESLKLANKNIDLTNFKSLMVRDINAQIKNRELTPDEGNKIISFIQRNVLTKPSKNGAFDDLHKLRKRLNLDFTDGDFDAARYVADSIRKVVSKMPDAGGLKSYKMANKVYGDLQDAQYILAKLNKKGAGINKSAIASLSGILASGGGFAPVQYFLGHKMGNFMADKIKRAFTTRLVKSPLTRIGTNPLVDARREVREAIGETGRTITKVKGELNAKIAKKVEDTLRSVTTSQDVNKAANLIRSIAEHPKAAQYKKELKKLADSIKTKEDYDRLILRRDANLPKRFKMTSTSRSLPMMLSAIFGVSMLAGGDNAEAMTEEAKAEPGFVEKYLSSSPVTITKKEEPVIPQIGTEPFTAQELIDTVQTANNTLNVDKMKADNPEMIGTSPTQVTEKVVEKMPEKLNSVVDIPNTEIVDGKIMYKARPKLKTSGEDLDELAAIMYGEMGSRSDAKMELEALVVANIAMNRAEQNGTTLTEELRKRKQFHALDTKLYKDWKDGSVAQGKGNINKNRVETINRIIEDIKQGKLKNDFGDSKFYSHLYRDDTGKPNRFEEIPIKVYRDDNIQAIEDWKTLTPKAWGTLSKKEQQALIRRRTKLLEDYKKAKVGTKFKINGNTIYKK